MISDFISILQSKNNVIVSTIDLLARLPAQQFLQFWKMIGMKKQEKLVVIDYFRQLQGYLLFLPLLLRY